MSYYLEAAFAQCQSETEALVIAKQVCNWMVRNDEEVLNECFHLLVRAEEGNAHLFSSVIRSIFTPRFLYWPNYSLLAMYGGRIPCRNTMNLLSKPIVFQDGTDQNYSMEEWPDNIPFFAEIKSLAKTIPRDQLAAHEESDQKVEYNRQSWIYQTVCDKLKIGEDMLESPGGPEQFALTTCDRHLQKLVTRGRILLARNEF